MAGDTPTPPLWTENLIAAEKWGRPPWEIEADAPDLWMDRWWAFEAARAEARKPSNDALRAQAEPMPADMYADILRQMPHE